MNKLLKGVLWALAIEASIVAVVWVCVHTANTGWAAPVGAMVLLLAFIVDFGAGRAKTR